MPPGLRKERITVKKIIKRVVAALLAATLVMALCGCGAQMADVKVEKDGS